MNFYKKLTEHKGIEIELLFNKDFWYWFRFNINWSRKMDHAGFDISIDLLWFYLDLNIYDGRHWNDDENRWYEYNEEQE
jgi:hypothetical protein